jgi:hypothetical protein
MWERYKNLNSKFWIYPLLFLIMVIYLHGHKSTIKQEIMGIHVWRQTQTQLNIRQFTRNDFNIFNPRSNQWNGGSNIRRFEFPIMQWLVAAVLRIGGESIFLTRVVICFFTFIGFIGLFKLFNLLVGKPILAIIASSLYLFCPLIYYYGIAPMPDNFALMCTIWYCYYYFLFIKSDYLKLKYAYLASALLCLAILAKLPYALFGIMPLVSLYKNQNLPLFRGNTNKFIFAFSLPLLVSGMWYVSAFQTWGTASIVGGILNGMDSLRAYLVVKHHIIFTSVDFLFNTLSIYYFIIAFLLTSVGYFKSNSIYKKYCLAIMLMVLIYFFYELNMIDTIHDYYMMPFLIPLYIIVLFGLNYIEKKYALALVVPFLFMWFVPSVSYKETKRYWTPEHVAFDPVLFTDYKLMASIVPDTAKCIFINDDSGTALSYFFDKEGYNFNNDMLPAPWIQDMVENNGVRYMYTNSRKVDMDSSFTQFVDNVIYDRGIFKIIKLKDPKKTR